MKAAKITVAGTTYFLVMDGEAMFTIRDIYGGTRLMLEKMEQDTREGFLETCNAAAILAERGELVRRRLGYEPGRIPERDDFALLTQPYEIVPLKRAIANAIKLGYGREITAPGDDEVVDARRLGPHTARIGGKVLDTVHGPDHGLGHG